VDRLQAQVRQRRERLGAQQRVAQLEQRIGAAGETSVQPGAEGAELSTGEGSSAMAAQPDRSKQPEAT
jgi:hypothetical protein